MTGVSELAGEPLTSIWDLPPHLQAGATSPRRDGPTDVDEAVEFLQRYHAENPDAGPAAQRIAWARTEIELTGTYQHTSDELAFGARVAWRNSARCIGRLYWRSMRVRDLRAIRNAAEVSAQCVEHLRIAGNRGKIRPVITVFAPDAPGRPGPRIWNEQLIRYAGYRRSDGSVLGDPRYVEFTEAVSRIGWRPPEPRSRFDLLPLVVSADQRTHVLPLPKDAVLEVPLAHPDFSWFAELGLRWHAVPAISCMRLSIGGVDYPAAPFSGWYLGTEIGARNLADTDRYDVMPIVAERLGLDTSSEQSLWRDSTLVEVNRAVLHSFAEAGVTISDHHTESARFLKHLAKEENAGRRCPADWSWIVPPMSGALTPVFHRYYDTDHLKPEFVTDEASMHTALRGTPPRFPAAANGSGGRADPWSYLRSRSRSRQVNGIQAS